MFGLQAVKLPCHSILLHSGEFDGVGFVSIYNRRSYAVIAARLEYLTSFLTLQFAATWAGKQLRSQTNLQAMSAASKLRRLYQDIAAHKLSCTHIWSTPLAHSQHCCLAYPRPAPTALSCDHQRMPQQKRKQGIQSHRAQISGLLPRRAHRPRRECGREPWGLEARVQGAAKHAFTDGLPRLRRLPAQL